MAGNRNGTSIQRVRPQNMTASPAQMDTAAGPQSVLLVELSASGALVDIAVPPPEGSFVTLVCGPLHRSACVAWAEGQRCSVDFVMPLTSAQVAAVFAPNVPPMVSAGRQG